MDHPIVMHPSRSSMASDHDVPESLIAKLSVTTGAPSSGLLSEAETGRLSEADIQAALDEIRARFRSTTRKNVDNRSVRRTLAQLALNKRILEEEREKRDSLRAAG